MWSYLLEVDDELSMLLVVTEYASATIQCFG